MEVACTNCGAEVLGREADGLCADEELCHKCYQLKAFYLEKYSRGHVERINVIQLVIALSCELYHFDDTFLLDRSNPGTS